MLDTRNIPELEGLNYRQRMLIIKHAQQSLPLPKKALMYSIKSLILLPPFFLLAQLQSWWILPAALLVFLVFPVLSKPVTLFFVKSQLSVSKQALKDSTEFNQ